MRAWIWIALHAVVVLVPGIALALQLPDARLFGSEDSPAFPQWSFGGWTDEKVQKDLKTWFEAHLGFRGAMVRTDNTIFYESVGETKPEASVKRGAHDTLFIVDDLRYGALSKEPDIGPVREVAELMADMQTRLGKVGKHLVVIVVPVKTSIYPDEVPSEWRRGPSPSPISNRSYEMVRQSLTDAGVKFTDGREILSRSLAEREILYPRTARHWSTVGACRVLREAIRGIVAEPTCDYEYRPIDTMVLLHDDFDLYRLLNLWHSSSAASALYLTQPPATEGLRALFVGTSFVHELYHVSRPVMRVGEFFYYNKTVLDVHADPITTIEPVDPKSPNWSHYALDKDIYITEILESWPSAMSVRDFLVELRTRL